MITRAFRLQSNDSQTVERDAGLVIQFNAADFKESLIILPNQQSGLMLVANLICSPPSTYNFSLSKIRSLSISYFSGVQPPPNSNTKYIESLFVVDPAGQIIELASGPLTSLNGATGNSNGATVCGCFDVVAEQVNPTIQLLRNVDNATGYYGTIVVTNYRRQQYFASMPNIGTM